MKFFCFFSFKKRSASFPLKMPFKRFAALVAYVCTATAFAHHYDGNYDQGHPVMLSGTVRTFLWENPHAWLYVEVPDRRGGSALWSFEGSSVRVLVRNGWTAHSVKPGQHIRVKFVPSRDGSDSGGLKQVIFDNGSSLEIAIL